MHNYAIEYDGREGKLCRVQTDLDEAVRFFGLENICSIRDIGNVLEPAFLQQKLSGEQSDAPGLAQGLGIFGNCPSLFSVNSIVKEAAIYVPQKTLLFVRDSPILHSLESVTKATQAARKSRYFYVNSKPYETQAEEDKNKPPHERRVLIYKNSRKWINPFTDSQTVIPLERFGEEELTLWAFGENAQDIGNFLQNVKIKDNQLYISGLGTGCVDVEKKAIAYQLNFTPIFGHIRCNTFLLNVGVRSYKSRTIQSL